MSAAASCTSDTALWAGVKMDQLCWAAGSSSSLSSLLVPSWSGRLITLYDFKAFKSPSRIVIRPCQDAMTERIFLLSARSTVQVLDADIFFIARRSAVDLFHSYKCAASSPVCDSEGRFGYQSINDAFPVSLFQEHHYSRITNDANCFVGDSVHVIELHGVQRPRIGLCCKISVCQSGTMGC